MKNTKSWLLILPLVKFVDSVTVETQVIFHQESLLASNVDRMVTGQGSVQIRTREVIGVTL